MEDFWWEFFWPLIIILIAYWYVWVVPLAVAGVFFALR